MTEHNQSLIGNAEDARRARFEAWYGSMLKEICGADTDEIAFSFRRDAEGEYSSNKVHCSYMGFQAAEQRILEMLGSKDFVEHIGVAIAEAYVLIPKDMPWESATEKLEEAVLAAIKERIGE